MRVSIRNVSKCFGQTRVLRNVSVEIEHQELFFLLGPSGCGKTTLLRTLAGFYEPDEGELFFGDRKINGVPAHKRNTGMVFQNYALWPHLTVEQNVAYGLEVRGVKGEAKGEAVMKALKIVRMDAYAARTPNQLSGGQQQRVALARALVIQPDVLLLDEPLSNLDARLRLEMREEIRRIHEETRITTVYVTHDQKESLSMADRMAVLREGVIEQIGEPRSVYRSPANRFVADFIGESNWFEAVVQKSSEPFMATTVFGTFEAIRDGTRAGQLKPGQKIWLGFRPEAAQIGPAELNSISSRIQKVTYLGEVEQYELEVAPGIVVKAFEQNPLLVRNKGETLVIHIRPQDWLVLPAE
ncbi:MAG: ABC transporter ATP-binding protein [Verrucomicrobiota bacterium]